MGFWNQLCTKKAQDFIVRKTDREIVAETIGSIKKNVELVLNSRQGCTLCAPELGLKDFNDATADKFSISVNIIADIQNNISRFEPRLRVSHIEFIPDPYDELQLNFRMICTVLLKKRDELTELNIILDSANRKFKVA